MHLLHENCCACLVCSLIYLTLFASVQAYITSTVCVCVSSSLKGAGFPLHLLPKCVPSGSLAGKTCSQWHGIPAGTPVGAALGDFQCSVYSCMSERTDAGETGYPFISLNELNAQCSHSWLWICIYKLIQIRITLIIPKGEFVYSLAESQTTLLPIVANIYI